MQVPEGSCADTEVRSWKVPVQSLGEALDEGFPPRCEKNEETEKNCQAFGDST